MAIQNPRLTDVSLTVRLTHDDNQQPLLYIEHGGYFPIPAAVLSQLEQAQVHFPEKAESDMSTRLVLHAMLSNQAV